MIKQDDIIKAEEGKVLLYKPENKIWGKSARLALYNGRQLTEEDFEEEYFDGELYDIGLAKIEGEWYAFNGREYAYIKAFIVKLHYSYDDQIALILNYAENPEKYGAAYQEMQEWRDVAGQIAKRLTEKE